MSNLLGAALASSALGTPKKAVIVIHEGAAPEIDSSSIAKATDDALTQGVTPSLPTQTPLHTLEVQYNPSTVQMQANAESVPARYLQQNLDAGIPTQLQRPPSVVLSVELIFDQMNIADSFMLEKFTGGVSAQSVTNVLTMASKKVWSVQSQTNGLVAALMKDSKRMVTFRWADMSFSGEVSEIQARYTMFSPTGHPVRSQVRLNITQQVVGKADTQYWDQVFDKMFAKSSEASGKRVLQNVGSLLNIGF